MKKIAIVGSGFIGESLGKGFKSIGHDVNYYDIVDKDLPGFSNNIYEVIENTDFSFICVPTPTADRKINLNYIRDAVEKVSEALTANPKYHVLVVKSTIIPTTMENLVLPIVRTYKKVGEEVGLCVSPEFLTQISGSWTGDKNYTRDFFSEDRIVIGEYDEKSGDTLEELYKPLGKPIFRTDLKTAEMIKYASNCMLATKISFWNEIHLICNKLNINSQTVADISGLDTRIGRYGTIHGKAFGGSCLPKDLGAFLSFAENFYEPELLRAVEKINEEMKRNFGERQ